MFSLIKHSLVVDVSVLSKKISNCCRNFATAKKNIEMVKVLNVAEKNDVAKNVANILSRGTSRRREGYSKFNKIYEFQMQLPALRNQQCQMIMTSVSGHLLNYDFIGDYSRWNGCDPRVLFSAPITTTCSDQCKLIKRTIEREVRVSSLLIIWTDCDREGENIGFEIVKICQAIKPDIRVLRAHFSEITSAAIYRAINSLTEPDKKISGICKGYFIIAINLYL